VDGPAEVPAPPAADTARLAQVRQRLPVVRLGRFPAVGDDGLRALCSSLASDLSSDLSELDGSSPLAESAVMSENELSAMSNTALTLFYVSLALLGAGLAGHTVPGALPSGHEDEVRDQDLRDADEAAERSP